MKIREIISESKEGDMPGAAIPPNKGEWRFKGADGADRIYNLNRVMMAAAMSDGSGDAVDVDQASWVRTYNIARPYSEEEHNMMKAAFKSIDSKYEETESDHRSLEMGDTNKQSIVAPRKKNKYGV
jgi:hypothetical protein